MSNHNTSNLGGFILLVTVTAFFYMEGYMDEPSEKKELSNNSIGLNNQSKTNMDTYDRLGGGTCGPIAVIGNTVLRGFSYKNSKQSYSSAIDKMDSSQLIPIF